MARLLAGCIAALGGAEAIAQGIYTCVDGQGRRLTSDRPIIECIDREQRELSPNGLTRRKIGPSLTAEERAAQEEKARKAAEENNRLAEEKRRTRALLVRYPNQASHDKERQAALATVDDLIATAHGRSAELATQRKALAEEAEFYRADPSRMPARLKRLVEENEQQQAAQQRYVADQQAEKQRISARFDEELVRLKQLWALQAAPPAAAPAPVATPTAATATSVKK